jgi:RpiR family transcriptional regulator, repressor of rpiB and als operon
MFWRPSFSYSGQNLPVLDAVRQARRNGAKVIAITNRLTSKLTKESDFALCVTADDSPLGGEHGAAPMVQLSIVDALFMAVAQRNPAATETNLSRTMFAPRTHEERW